MKVAIFKVILPNFKEKNWLIADLSKNDHPLSPYIFNIPKKFISMINILEFQNDTKVPSVLKLQDSDVGSVIPKYPK